MSQLVRRAAPPPDKVGVPAREAAAVPLPLTAIVLTLNEARDLPDCLESVAGFAERLVVLDSGSDDATVAIARRYTTHVYSRPFTGYASQRTAALQYAAHPWVLFLDADERLTPAGRAEIARVLAGADANPTAPAGYWIPRHNEFFGRRVRGGGWWPDAQLRLFRRDRARYDPAREVHEVVEVDGPTGTLVEPLVHRNYDSWAEFHAKQRVYARHHARDLLRRGVHPRPWTYFTQPLREFRRRYVTLGAWREGWLGLQLAAALAWYEALAHLRLRGLARARWRPAYPPPRVPRGAALFAQSATLDLSIVVVSHNTRDLLRHCLESVTAALAGGGLAWELIVVDHASTDGTLELLRAAFPDVQLIASAENRGFAAGLNRGLRVARGRALLLLNPDTEVAPGALRALLDRLAADPTTGAVGPRLHYPDGTVQESRRRFPTPLTPFLESTLVQRYWRRNRVLDRYYVADRPATVSQAVDWLYGACLLVRRAALEATGGFDESFFLYSEELEWFVRLRRAGWRAVYEPAALVVHHEGASSAETPARRQIAFHASKVLFYQRYYGLAFAELLRHFLLATYLVQAGQEAAKWLLGHKRPLRRQRLVAYRAVLRSRLRVATLMERSG